MRTQGLKGHLKKILKVKTKILLLVGHKMTKKNLMRVKIAVLKIKYADSEAKRFSPEAVLLVTLSDVPAGRN